MINVKRKEFEKEVNTIIDANDTRKLVKKFSKDLAYHYYLLSDISKGAGSPNWDVICEAAGAKKVGNEFPVEQAKTLLGYLFPYDETQTDFYQVLKVSKNSTDDEIRQSWIALMKEHHPDRIGEEGLELTKKYNEAYEVLGDAQKRRQYDSRQLPEVPVIIEKEVAHAGSWRNLSYILPFALVIFLALSYIIGSDLLNRTESDKNNFARTIEDPTLNDQRLEERVFETTRGTSITSNDNEQILNPDKIKPPNIKDKLQKAAVISRADNETQTEANDSSIEVVQSTPETIKDDGTDTVSTDTDQVSGTGTEPITEESALDQSKQVLADNSTPVVDIKSDSGKDDLSEQTEKADSTDGSGAKTITYVVKEGDNLWSIARQHDTRTAKILALNDLEDNEINIGDSLLIPVEEYTTEVAALAPPPVQGSDTAQKLMDDQSVNDFVSQYVTAYKQRDLDKMSGMFLPEANENGTPISKVLSSYKKNFSTLDIVQYEVRTNETILKDQSARVNSDFDVTFKNKKTGKIKSSNGTISWELEWKNNGWNIKEINYKILSTKVLDG